MIEIVPMRSVGELVFGQTSDEVMRTFGPPSRIVSEGQPSRTVRQHFETKKIICHYDERGRLNLVTIQRSDRKLMLLGADVFSVDVSALLGKARIRATRTEDSFGVVTIHAPSLGLDFCFEEGELLAVHAKSEREPSSV